VPSTLFLFFVLRGSLCGEDHGGAAGTADTTASACVEDWHRRAHAAQPTATCPFATLVANILAAVGTETNPEIKRKKIGAAFLAVENDVLAHLPRDAWLLGQRTIYPDTIESGHARVGADYDASQPRARAAPADSSPRAASVSSAGCASTVRRWRTERSKHFKAYRLTS
jgi:hypothetical protein